MRCAQVKIVRREVRRRKHSTFNPLPSLKWKLFMNKFGTRLRSLQRQLKYLGIQINAYIVQNASHMDLADLVARVVSTPPSLVPLAFLKVTYFLCTVCASRFSIAKLKASLMTSLVSSQKFAKQHTTKTNGRGNSSPLHDSQGVDELATLDRYHHFHGHSGLCA